MRQVLPWAQRGLGAGAFRGGARRGGEAQGGRCHGLGSADRPALLLGSQGHKLEAGGGTPAESSEQDPQAPPPQPPALTAAPLQIVKFLPGNSTAPRVDCAFLVSDPQARPSCLGWEPLGKP